MKKVSLAALAVLLGGSFLISRGQLPQTDNGVSPDTALARKLEVFNTVARYLSQVYVDSLRPDEAMNTAIAGMLYTVDPYTEYYDSEDMESLEIMTTGSYGGIGAFVLGKDGDTYISMPIEGSPSFKAGLKSGDRILRVDSVDVIGKPTDFTTRHLKGDPGTTVVVTVERPYTADSILSLPILRERVQDRSVPFAGVVDSVGYIKLTSFVDKSAQEVRHALESFKESPGVKGIVLDLRDNGGGLVTSAVDILGMFLPKETKVIETRGKVKDSNKEYTTNRSPLIPDLPLVVMINSGSASAAEITAGAVQDLDRGVLVGQRSFGKGLVQSTLSLPHDGALKVTTAKYHLPSGRLIQALDYSHRNPDGSVAHTPDSLTHEFLTHKGRTVRDGGGLVPDTVIELKEMSRTAYNLMRANQIFDYATRYAAHHPYIDSPAQFTISDDEFADFVAFVDTAKVKGDDSAQRYLEELRKGAEKAGVLSDSLAVALGAIEPMVSPDLRRDLYYNRPEIEELLGREIVGRYHYRAGEEEFSLRFDDEFAIARDIILNSKLYDSLLEPRDASGSDGSGKNKAKGKK